MTTNELFLNCISAFLHGGKIEAPQETDRQELVLKAQQQKLLPMVYEVLGASMPENIRRSCKQDTVRQIMGQMQRTAEFLKTYEELSAKGITPLVVKGIVCRSTYDKPDHRTSADEDLYVPLADYPTFHKAMLNIGFTAKEPDYKNAHEERYTRNGLLIEGHWELFPQENSALNALNVYTADFWKRAGKQTFFGVELLALEPTDHMVFLLLHAFKHFINSGVGVRQICDIAQWSKAYEINWTYVKEVMTAANADCFASAVFDAGEKYFGMTFPCDWERADCTALLADALDGGIYGSSDMSRKHSGSITLGAVEAVRNDSKKAPLMQALFPKRAVMEMKYPWLKKSVLLLPFAWGARMLGYLASGGQGNSAAESIKIGNERLELMRQYKII